MSFLWLLLVIMIVAGLFWVWWQRRERPTETESSATNVAPTKVILPEDETNETGERAKRRRTGENQELRRKVVRGEYRAIEDRGEPTDVHLPKQS